MVARPSSVPLARADAAWLRMDRPTNPMVITGLLLLDGRLQPQALQSLIEERLLRFRRFRAKVVVRPFHVRPQWEELQGLDGASQLGSVRAAPADPRAIQRILGERMSSSLPAGRPLWELDLIELGANRSAIICRLHHALGDGAALLSVLLSLTDPLPAAPEPRRGGEREAAVSPRSSLAATPEPRPVGEREADVSPRSSLAAAPEPRPVGEPGAAGPPRPSAPARLGRWFAGAFRSAATLGRLLLLPPEPRTRLRGGLSREKRAAWSRPIPLEQLREAGHRAGATVNDLLLAAVSGALRRYLAGQGEEVGSLRALVPVDLRRGERRGGLGNRFGGIFVALPVGLGDPAARLRAQKEELARRKRSPEAVLLFRIVQALGSVSAFLEKLAVRYLSRRISVVITNVRGPRERRLLGGVPLRRVIFWVPQSGAVGLGVSLLSYAGEVTVGVSSDAGLVPDPETIVSAVEDELAALGV